MLASPLHIFFAQLKNVNTVICTRRQRTREPEKVALYISREGLGTRLIIHKHFMFQNIIMVTLSTGPRESRFSHLLLK